MDFSWDNEQLEFKNLVIDFAKKRLNKPYVTQDKSCVFSREDWQECADFGIHGLTVPERYGGKFKEVDIMRVILAMEGLGHGCTDNGLPFAINAQMWTVQLPISHFGNEIQKQKYLPGLASGKLIGCHALTEMNAGSDVFQMETTAKKVEGGYIINGHKRLITLGPVADIALVFAMTNQNLGKWGMSAFIIETDTQGFSASTNMEKMGLRTVPIGELTFKDCFVSEENRLGKEGAGWSIMNHSLELDRCGILASQLGAMERQLMATIDFVKQRKQFGKPIGSFQAVSHRIADMKLRLETSRLLLYKVAWLKSKGKPAMMEAALLKLQLSECFILSSIDAIRNHGGNGYLTHNEVERDLRDAIGGIIYAGTSDIQKNIIINLLGL